MTVGLPGAGIGGLFYLASTLMLPVRSLVRRFRGRPDDLTWRRQAYIVLLALGIIGSLWLAGWLLAFVAPARMLASSSVGASVVGSRSVIPLATFGIGAATLAIVLIAVEVAHRFHAPARATPARRPG